MFQQAVLRSTDAAAAVFDRLQPLLGDRLTRGEALREQHSRGEGIPERGVPDMVAFPATNEEVAAIAAACNDHRLPIVPFGTGTSLEGHVVALEGGVCVDLSRMVQILDVSAEAMDCRVQAGVTRHALNTELRSSGLFFPVDPGRMRRSAAWRRPAPPAPPRCATARCARTSWG